MPAPIDDTRQLLAFVRGRDVACPVCGYNLRDLTEPRCPECKERLSLSVGVYRPPIGWLIATITPSSFSAIAAALLFIPIAMGTLNGYRPPWPVFVLDGFGWASGLTGLLLFRHRFAFLRMQEDAQIMWATTTWVTHVGAFIVTFIVLASL